MPGQITEVMQQSEISVCSSLRGHSGVPISGLLCSHVKEMSFSPHGDIFISKRADYHKIFQIALPPSPLQHQESLQFQRRAFAPRLKRLKNIM